MIVKHNNPCGVAIGADALEAYLKALACDPVSAFGGVIALNRPIGEELAEELHKNFVEVLIAPGYEDGALDGAAAEGGDPDPLRGGAAPAPTRANATSNGCCGGLLIQDRDGDPEPREIMEVVTGDAAERGAVGRHAASPGPSAAASAPTRS